MSGGLGSRTTAPKYDVILAALDLGLQAWRTTASRDRFIDAGAELGHARVAYDKEHAARVRAEEALRELREAVTAARYESDQFVGDPGQTVPIRTDLWQAVLEVLDRAAVPEENKP